MTENQSQNGFISALLTLRREKSTTMLLAAFRNHPERIAVRY
jgi:hypothetical protein